MAEAPSAPSTKPRPGLVLAGATLTAPLREERLYSIWRATREGRPCAAYVLAAVADVHERERFKSAAREMQRLATTVPAVLAIHAIAEDGASFAAALHDTGTLEHIPSLALPIARRVELVASLCEALGELHARGVVHGCLRPSSVLLEPSLALVISDVGLADVTAELAIDERDAMGFGAYGSPEAATGGALDARSDVFSVGRILQFLLLGFVPDPIIEPISKLDALTLAPVSLTRIARKCVALDPAARYATISDLASDLARHGGNLPVGAPHPDEGRPRDSRPSVTSGAPVSIARVSAARPSVSRASTTDDDDLPKAHRLTIAIVSALVLAGIFGAVFAGVVPGGVVRFAMLAGCALAFAGSTLAIPIEAKRPRLRRVAYALVVGALAAVANPAALLGESLATMRISSGGGAANGPPFKAAIALGQRIFLGVDLHGADLAHAELGNLELKGADLSDANLAGANLAFTSLAEADLSGADLSGTDVRAVFGLPTARCNAATKLPKGWTCEGGHPLASAR